MVQESSRGRREDRRIKAPSLLEAEKQKCITWEGEGGRESRGGRKGDRMGVKGTE